MFTHKREIYEDSRTFGTLLTGQYIPAGGPALISVWDVQEEPKWVFVFLKYHLHVFK